MSDRIRLGDDGTMDTVLVCRQCGAEARYNYDGPNDIEAASVDGAMEQLADADEQYRAFVAWAIEDFDSEHDCSETEADDAS